MALLYSIVLYCVVSCCVEPGWPRPEDFLDFGHLFVDFWGPVAGPLADPGDF